MNTNPLVSVIIPSFNHETYIRECIDSVLSQTYQDFEIIITDDGSSDKTVDIIKTYVDERIHLFEHKYNLGASVATNNCITHSRGKYIAMLSSDDIWDTKKLEIQVSFLEENIDIAAVFSKVDWIDGNGNYYDKNFIDFNAFNVENKNNNEWLRYFFYFGNSLCHPSSLIRKDVYDEIGYLNRGFANLPDFDLWVRLCLKNKIYILDEKLIKFRRISEEKNASGDNINSRIRNRFEYEKILDHYLAIDSYDQLINVFPELEKFQTRNSALFPFLIGQLAIETGIDFFIHWGLDQIYYLLQEPKSAQLLKEELHFDYIDFIKLSGICDPYKINNKFIIFLSRSFRLIINKIKNIL